MSHPPASRTLAGVVLLATVVAARAGNAGEGSGAQPQVRVDAVAVRLAASASASIPGRATPLAAGSAQRLRPAAGPLAILAGRLDLTFEPAFRSSEAPARDAALASAPDPSAERRTRDWVVHLPVGLSPDRAVEALRAETGVERAELLWEQPVSAVPNDSLWSSAYYFYQPSRRDVHAVEAWDITTGDSTDVIAIIDTGVLMTHPDLAGPGPGIGGNIWTNAAEANGTPGVDDDHNGYVDDVHGWDFIDLRDSTIAVRGEDWGGQDPDPNDFVGHGTGVAGIAAAITNNGIGVAGAAGGARIMPLRVGYSATAMPGGLVDEAAAAEAIDYAAVSGATVINCSFATGPSFLIADALDHAYRAGVTVVFAAGNNNSAHAMADRPEVISVAAVDAGDTLTAFTNTGAYVDLAAAGLFLTTTTVHKEYAPDSSVIFTPVYSTHASGTSFSAPLVAGAVALIQANARKHGLPRPDPVSALLRLVETTDDISLQNPTATGYGSGRVNFLRALTDPPGSYAVRLDGTIVGAAAVTRSRAGRTLAIVGTSGAHLSAIDGTSRAIAWSATLPGPPIGSPAAADLGGGRGPGVFVTVATGQVCGFDDAGFPLPGWPVTAPGSAAVASPPALADVDGDSSPEVVVGDAAGGIHAWRRDGTELPGFPAPAPGVEHGARIALADVDGDGLAEIVVTYTSGRVAVLARDGRPLPGWPMAPGAGSLGNQPPVVAMLDTDRRPAVIVAERTAGGGVLRAYDPDGSQRWSLDVGSPPAGSPAVADVDGDGRPEILVPREAGDVLVASGDGVAERVTAAGDSSLPGSLTPEIIVGEDLSGSPLAQWTAHGALLERDLKTGAAVPSTRWGEGTPTVADADGDGRLDLLVPSDSLRLLYVYSTGDSGVAREWPTSRGNAARTGSAIAPGADIADVVPPRAVTDLVAITAGPGAVDLEWTAPFEGRGGRARRYDVRVTPASLDATTFPAAVSVPAPPAPGASGAREHLHVGSLAPDRVYSFALVSDDSAGNISAMSNVARASGTLPVPVADLRIGRVAGNSLELEWTSTGNDGRGGRAAAYDVRAAEQPIDASNFDAAAVRMLVTATAAAGVAESSALEGLEPGHRYWIALRAVDSLGNASPISNVVSSVPGPFLGRAGAGIVAARMPSGSPVKLFWQAGVASLNESSRIRVFDASGRLCRTLATAAAAEGIAVWDGASDDGTRQSPGVYFARLETRSARAMTRFVLLR